MDFDSYQQRMSYSNVLKNRKNKVMSVKIKKLYRCIRIESHKTFRLMSANLQ